jgi:UDP-N-acetylmuramate dehydrogenase
MRSGFPIGHLTTFRIGGPAAVYVEPESLDDLRAVSAAAAVGVEVTVLGKGSNVLVSDAGVDGIVLRLGRGFRWSARDGNVLGCGAAMPLPALSGIAASHSLTGLEFGIAIPGSVGGAVRMNAGAHGSSISEVLDHVEVWSLPESRVIALRADDIGFSYRRSQLPARSFVVNARFALSPAEREDIRQRMSEAREWRRATQPLGEPNCGSVFKNPPNDHAARLVEECGLKGLSVGGAMVSPKHANFIVTSPGATAADVLGVIGVVVTRVREMTGVTLEREVQLVGRF